MKKLLLISALVTGLASTSPAALLISGAVDGTQTGGNPKALELYATTAIPDLSAFWISRDTNGAGPWDTFVQLPSVSLSQGDFFIIAGSTDAETSLTDLGFTVGLVDSIANVNGDDILGLSTSDSASDVFDSIGVVAQGDTNFYADSFAVRMNTSTTPSISSTDGSNFTITGYTDGGIQGAAGFNTYSPVPEPSIALLGGLGLLGLLRRRR